MLVALSEGCTNTEHLCEISLRNCSVSALVYIVFSQETHFFFRCRVALAFRLFDFGEIRSDMPSLPAKLKLIKGSREFALLGDLFQLVNEIRRN